MRVILVASAIIINFLYIFILVLALLFCFSKINYSHNPEEIAFYGVIAFAGALKIDLLLPYRMITR